MQDSSKETDLSKTPSYLSATLRCKCPRCRRGDLFVNKNPYNLGKKFMKMNEKCPVCGQPTEIEVGFYYGTSYVSYALGVAFSVALFVAWKVLFGLSFLDNSIFWWLGTDIVLLILLQPIFMCLSRSLWISWYVKYNPNWRTEKPKYYERLNDDLKNAW
ncbi:DUF983 domain-containing protein [Arachidicoccus ginsenosidimutans]|uniref:DUF983 domain-containing protein n=1 Tax=Arachidicoccus sp. BS20 TaxID=1850526 RepID=UPI0007F137C0|nr:DUF983 domain-containing protein [Arachidicoccus sp. BS20]ANI89530.1 DUF983 domain-containing protein [Arachidicoccus sp. BS20]